MMNDLIQQIAELKARDRQYHIFGANGHRYHSKPIQLVDIQHFEHSLGVVLPSFYRNVLLTNGFGAGPYYGLWEPEEILAEWLDWHDDYQQSEGITVDPARPFPFTKVDAATLIENWQAQREPSLLSAAWPCNGCIPIGHQGCAYWSILVTSGEIAGTVWDFSVQVGFDGDYAPARRAPGVVSATQRRVSLPELPVPPSFEEWYQGWIEQALADLVTV